MYDLLIYIIIITAAIVGAAAYHENKKYKNSSYGKQSKHSFFQILNDQGAKGEYRMSEVLDQAAFPKKLIFNVYLPKTKAGETTEVDIIMISTKGIYVVENKNYSGWIFGDEQSKNWCETLKGKKYFFYNPVKQNATHIKYLEKFLNVGTEKYTSLITFNSSANLKKVTTESENVHVIAYKNLTSFLKNENNKPDIIKPETIEEIYNNLYPLTQVTEEQKQQHINNIKTKYKK